jgi:hypothetical protein
MSAFCIALALWLLVTLLVLRVRVIAELAGAAVLILIALAVAGHFRSARGTEPPWLPGAQWLNPAAPEIKPIQPGPVQLAGNPMPSGDASMTAGSRAGGFRSPTRDVPLQAAVSMLRSQRNSGHNGRMAHARSDLRRICVDLGGRFASRARCGALGAGNSQVLGTPDHPSTAGSSSGLPRTHASRLPTRWQGRGAGDVSATANPESWSNHHQRLSRKLGQDQGVVRREGF